MVNTHSDEVQDLIESKLETKFKKVDFILIEEVEKTLLKLYPLKLNRFFKRKLKKTSIVRPFYRFSSTM